MKNLILTLVILTLSACGLERGSNQSDDSTVSETDAVVPGPVAPSNVRHIAVYDNLDAFLGYVLDFEAGAVHMYFDSLDIYAAVHPTTGEYLTQPSREGDEIYFEEVDCQGDAVILSWNGETGKTVIKAKDDRFFVVNSATTYSTSNEFASLSRLSSIRPSDDGCSNQSATIRVRAGNLEELNELPDLTTYSPLKLYEVSSDND